MGVVGTLMVRRQRELEALAQGLDVYIAQRRVEEEQWDGIEELPPAYKVGIKVIRKPTTNGLEFWRRSAARRAGWWR